MRKAKTDILQLLRETEPKGGIMGLTGGTGNKDSGQNGKGFKDFLASAGAANPAHSKTNQTSPARNRANKNLEQGARTAGNGKTDRETDRKERLKEEKTRSDLLAELLKSGELLAGAESAGETDRAQNTEPGKTGAELSEAEPGRLENLPTEQSEAKSGQGKKAVTGQPDRKVADKITGNKAGKMTADSSRLQSNNQLLKLVKLPAAELENRLEKMTPGELKSLQKVLTEINNSHLSHLEKTAKAGEAGEDVNLKARPRAELSGRASGKVTGKAEQKAAPGTFKLTDSKDLSESNKGQQLEAKSDQIKTREGLTTVDTKPVGKEENVEKDAILKNDSGDKVGKHTTSQTEQSIVDRAPQKASRGEKIATEKGLADQITKPTGKNLKTSKTSGSGIQQDIWKGTAETEKSPVTAARGDQTDGPTTRVMTQVNEHPVGSETRVGDQSQSIRGQSQSKSNNFTGQQLRPGIYFKQNNPVNMAETSKTTKMPEVINDLSLRKVAFIKEIAAGTSKSKHPAEMKQVSAGRLFQYRQTAGEERLLAIQPGMMSAAVSGEQAIIAESISTGRDGKLPLKNSANSTGQQIEGLDRLWEILVRKRQGQSSNNTGFPETGDKFKNNLKTNIKANLKSNPKSNLKSNPERLENGKTDLKFKGSIERENRHSQDGTLLQQTRHNDRVNHSIKDTVANSKVPGDMLDRISEQVKYSRKTGQKAVQIQLEPEHLGKLKIYLKVAGENVMVKFRVDNPEARNFLEHNFQELKNNLIKDGFNPGSIQLETSSNQSHYNQQQYPGNSNQQELFFQQQNSGQPGFGEQGGTAGESILAEAIQEEMEEGMTAAVNPGSSGLQHYQSLNLLA